MRKFLVLASALAIAACATTGGQSDVPAFGHPPMSPEAILGHVNVLASDEFEGRAPDSPGEERTIAYLQRAFEAAGLEPGARGADGRPAWTQEVPLSESEVQGSPVLTITGADGARPYAYRTHFVAGTRRFTDSINVANAPLVFVGYGVVAPERNWNDYAGIDMRGKIAVILINDPDFELGTDGGFGGRAMTYYGRWTYKYEEAARQGAAGALIIHETAPASYGWATVQSSWTGPQFDVVRADGGMSRTEFEGWITTDVGRELFDRAGLDFAALKASAQRPGFTPVAMGNLTGSLQLQNQISQSRSANFIALLPGTERADEAIVYSAHWDHLGRCDAVDGDDICNGALDNATGTAGLIEIARQFVAQGASERSVVFAAVAAEEQGLLGSMYYADHPTFEPRNMVANINMDGLAIYGRAHDFGIVGYGKSEMDDIATEAAQAQGRRVTPDQMPERGGFFRSDQFHFARIGVPVLYGGSGMDLVEGGEARGRAMREAYTAHHYHQPSDEVSPDWDLSGGAQDLELFYAVGRRLADGEEWPRWRPDAEFRAARVQSGRE